jgi:hypothetical protein
MANTITKIGTVEVKSLLAHILEQSTLAKKGLTRGTMLKLGYEYFETFTKSNPTAEEKELIRGVVQETLNNRAFRQDYEVCVKDKDFARLSGGKLVVGRDLKMLDTRNQSWERQATEIWSMLGAHQDYRSKHPLYEGSEAQERKTGQLKQALDAVLYHLPPCEKKTRIEKQYALWFPARASAQDTASKSVEQPAEVASV